MRTIIASVPVHLVQLVEALRARLGNPQFVSRHRVRPKDFTRQRQLTFPVVMLFVRNRPAEPCGARTVCVGGHETIERA